MNTIFYLNTSFYSIHKSNWYHCRNAFSQQRFHARGGELQQAPGQARGQLGPGPRAEWSLECLKVGIKVLLKFKVGI